MEEKYEKSEQQLAAERFTRKNHENLSKDFSENINCRPPNDNLLEKAGDLWIQANDSEKAEQFYERAGRYKYAHAAKMFEKINDSQRAKRFWALAAQNPTGYGDELDRNSAIYWEAAGEIQKAISFTQKAINLFRMQEGGYDLHGDPKNGNSEARILEREIERLEKILDE